MNISQVFAQESDPRLTFGFQPGFCFEHYTIDRCKTYYDSNAHILYNPCYDINNRGIYSSYFARTKFLGYSDTGDSILVLLPHMEDDIDWEELYQKQKETWDYYLKLWQKQDKLEKYYINLEGVVRSAMTGPIK